MYSQLKHVLTHCMKDDMVLHVGQHPECTEELIALAVSSEAPYNWRAAWLLSDFVNESSQLLLPAVPDLLRRLNQATDGHQRELLKILEQLPLSEGDQWQLYDICTEIWKDIHKQPSVRWHALRMLIRMLKAYPELKGEFEFLTEERYILALSPGAQRSVQKLLKAKRR